MRRRLEEEPSSPPRLRPRIHAARRYQEQEEEEDEEEEEEEEESEEEMEEDEEYEEEEDDEEEVPQPRARKANKAKNKKQTKRPLHYDSDEEWLPPGVTVGQGELSVNCIAKMLLLLCFHRVQVILEISL